MVLYILGPWCQQGRMGAGTRGSAHCRCPLPSPHRVSTKRPPQELPGQCTAASCGFPGVWAVLGMECVLRQGCVPTETGPPGQAAPGGLLTVPPSSSPGSFLPSCTGIFFQGSQREDWVCPAVPRVCPVCEDWPGTCSALSGTRVGTARALTRTGREGDVELLCSKAETFHTCGENRKATPLTSHGENQKQLSSVRRTSFW